MSVQVPGVMNFLSSTFDRQRARMSSTRVETNNHGDDDDEEGVVTTVEFDSNNNDTREISATRSSSSQQPAHQLRQQSQQAQAVNEPRDNNNNTDTASAAQLEDSLEDEEDEELGLPSTGGTATVTRRQTISLAELEEERELARRRGSACVLLAVFVLFRLWMICLQEQDFTILLLCLLGTSWTARWIRYHREREEELDRRIEQYLQAGDRDSVDRNDLRMLSFQAQLALAIMESQRHMLEGGRPDGDEQGTAGVSDQAKQQWQSFSFKAVSKKATPQHDEEQGAITAGAEHSGDYGSVMEPLKENTKSMDASVLADEEPSCSICLSEYEDGETLIRLPCGHVYHDACINSWTMNHTKCPLCNFELESSPAAGDANV